MNAIIGREYELQLLESYTQSENSEFVVVYGRRRVGKTFLIREFFNNDFTFYVTGLSNVTTMQQLVNFQTALVSYSNGQDFKQAKNWFEAFQQLKIILEQSSLTKKVVFIDELPWLDTQRSNFISALEHFWNSWASARKDILLITCGSAASWMLNKLINNKGGLHNRVTRKIKLLPFTLYECEAFLKSRKFKWNRAQIVETYMALGGIPYYLNQLDPQYSSVQNIDRLCFSDSGMLKNEFNNLYTSIFKNSEVHIRIITALSKKAVGLTRDEIIKVANISNGGNTTLVLFELESSGFIRKYLPFGKKERYSLYQLSDFYTLFYLKFINNNKFASENFWINAFDSPIYRTWCGYSFEQVCMQHIAQIKKALGVNGITTSESSWRSLNPSAKAQIDLLIDRNDNVINIIEVKYSINKFQIDKKYAENLRNKIGVFKSETKTNKAVFLSFISSYGTTKNEYSQSLLQNNFSMDMLFTSN